MDVVGRHRRTRGRRKVSRNGQASENGGMGGSSWVIGGTSGSDWASWWMSGHDERCGEE